MLDKLLHKHIDTMDEIEKSVISDIDSAIKTIDVPLLMEDPNRELMDVVEIIRHRILSKYAKEATRAGFDLAKKLEKIEDQGKDVIVDDSNDPAENKGIVDVRDNG